MNKSFFLWLAGVILVAGCAAPRQTAAPQASVGNEAAATVSSVDASLESENEEYETMYVPPPAGSLLGGGSVRIPKRKIVGSDEKALLVSIRRLNAAAGSKDERPFVVSSVSRVTGVSVRELQSQQDRLQLRFGDLCALNAIAQGQRDKVRAMAALRAKGQTWSDLARANGLGIAMVTQVARNASEMTEALFTNNAERRKGGNRKYHELNVSPKLQRPNG